jgi:hypothetical protein
MCFIGNIKRSKSDAPKNVCINPNILPGMKFKKRKLVHKKKVHNQCQPVKKIKKRETIIKK